MDDNQTSENLEQRCARSYNAVKDYLVDTAAAWLFYTPLMTASEYVAGMESKEVAKSRLMAMVVNAVVMRPYGKLRQTWADYWHADAGSSTLKKLAVDASYSILFQIPV